MRLARVVDLEEHEERAVISDKFKANQAKNHKALNNKGSFLD